MSENGRGGVTEYTRLGVEAVLARCCWEAGQRGVGGWGSWFWRRASVKARHDPGVCDVGLRGSGLVLCGALV